MPIAKEAVPISIAVVPIIRLPSIIEGDNTADKIRDLLLQAVQRGDGITTGQGVIIDGRGVEVFTSAGLRPLLTLHRLLHQEAKKVVLAGFHGRPLKLLRDNLLISGPSATGKPPFEHCDSIHEAVALLFSDKKREELDPY